MKRCLTEWWPFTGPSALPDALQTESVSGEIQKCGRGREGDLALIYLSFYIVPSFHDSFVFVALYEWDFNSDLIKYLLVLNLLKLSMYGSRCTNKSDADCLVILTFLSNRGTCFTVICLKSSLESSMNICWWGGGGREHWSCMCPEGLISWLYSLRKLLNTADWCSSLSAYNASPWL